MGCTVLKIKNKRDIVIFIIILPVFLWLSLNFAANRNNATIPYSVLNKGSKGISVMYEAMKKLNYPVKLTLERIDNSDCNSVQIVINSRLDEGFDINDKSIRKWIGKGGKLVFLCEKWENIEPDYGKKIDAFYFSNNKKAAAFSYKKGDFLIGDSELLTNKTLTTDTNGAYWMLRKIDNWDYSSIDFNEFYQYSNGIKRSLWDDIPSGIKLILYQVVFLIAAVIYYKGKQFGKPVPLYEEVERMENEYIFSVASLYRQAGCWEIVLESYYEDFLLECEKLFGKSECIREKWLELWKKEKMSKLNEASKLYHFMVNMDNEIPSSKKEKKKGKKYFEMISVVQQLNKILVKRREEYWIMLKKDIQKI